MSWRTPSHTFTSKPDPSLQNLTIFLALETNAAGKDCRFWHSPSHPVSWLGKFNGADKKNKLNCVHMCMCVCVCVEQLSHFTFDPSVEWLDLLHMISKNLHVQNKDGNFAWNCPDRLQEDLWCPYQVRAGSLHCSRCIRVLAINRSGKKKLAWYLFFNISARYHLLRLFSKMTPHDLCTR